MQGAVGFCVCSFNCKFTKESSSENNFYNRLRFGRIMVMSLWPRFLYTLVTVPTVIHKRSAVHYMQFVAAIVEATLDIRYLMCVSLKTHRPTEVVRRRR